MVQEGNKIISWGKFRIQKQKFSNDLHFIV